MSTFFFQPHTAPGREGAASAQPAQQQPAPSGSEAPPPPAGGLFGSGSMLLFLVLPLLLMFLLTRNQTKKQKQLESTLKTGDRVVTQSGLIGRVIDLGDRTVKVEIAPGVNVQMLKTAIQGLDATDKAAESAKVKEAAKDKPQEKKA